LFLRQLSVKNELESADRDPGAGVRR